MYLCGVVLQWLLEIFSCSAVAFLLFCLDYFGWVRVLHLWGGSGGSLLGFACDVVSVARVSRSAVVGSYTHDALLQSLRSGPNKHMGTRQGNVPADRWATGAFS